MKKKGLSINFRHVVYMISEKYITLQFENIFLLRDYNTQNQLTTIITNQNHCDEKNVTHV